MSGWDEGKGPYYQDLEKHSPGWAFTDDERAEAKSLAWRLDEICQWLETHRERIHTLTEMHLLVQGDDAEHLEEAELRLIRVGDVWSRDGVRTADKVDELLAERSEESS